MAALALALIIPAGASARTTQKAKPSFNAHGSAEQVYVTGLKPHARAASAQRGRHVVATQRADAQGGLLFRQCEARPRLPRPTGSQRRRVRRR